MPLELDLLLRQVTQSLQHSHTFLVKHSMHQVHTQYQQVKPQLLLLALVVEAEEAVAVVVREEGVRQEGVERGPLSFFVEFRLPLVQTTL
jgi:hypothetical protein